MLRFKIQRIPVSNKRNFSIFHAELNNISYNDVKSTSTGFLYVYYFRHKTENSCKISTHVKHNPQTSH